MKYKKLIILFLIMVSILSCKTVDEGISFPADLLGIIFDDYNNPVEGAEVIFSETKVFTSDIDGRFLLPRLDNESYSITIAKNGFESQTLNFDFFDPKQILYVKLSSIAFLREEIENRLAGNKFDEIPDLIDRALLIDDDDPILLYLTAIYYVKMDNYKKAKTYITLLKETGYEAEGIEQLSAIIDEE